jgi:hypothetical protein
MGKYTSVYEDAFSVFAMPTWISEGIKVVPQNYLASGLGDEYLRVSVLTGGNLAYRNLFDSVTGQLIIDIFVASGNGPKRLAAIADTLDTYLAQKTIYTLANHSIQFGSSGMNPMGLDSANPSLYRGSYSIPFNYFGT